MKKKRKSKKIRSLCKQRRNVSYSSQETKSRSPLLSTKSLLRSNWQHTASNSFSDRQEQNYDFYIFQNPSLRNKLTMVVMIERFTLQASLLYLFDAQFKKIKNLGLLASFEWVKNGLERFAIICAQLNGFAKLKSNSFVTPGERIQKFCLDLKSNDLLKLVPSRSVLVLLDDIDLRVYSNGFKEFQLSFFE